MPFIGIAKWKPGLRRPWPSVDIQRFGRKLAVGADAVVPRNSRPGKAGLCRRSGSTGSAWLCPINSGAGERRSDVLEALAVPGLSEITVMELDIGVRRIGRRDPRHGAMLRAWLTGGVLPVRSMARGLHCTPVGRAALIRLRVGGDLVPRRPKFGPPGRMSCIPAPGPREYPSRRRLRNLGKPL